MLSIGVMHERVATPSICTVQAPHSAMPQPNFVPVMPSTSRNHPEERCVAVNIDAVCVAIDFNGEGHGFLPQWRSSANCRVVRVRNPVNLATAAGTFDRFQRSNASRYLMFRHVERLFYCVGSRRGRREPSIFYSSIDEVLQTQDRRASACAHRRAHGTSRRRSDISRSRRGLCAWAAGTGLAGWRQCADRLSLGHQRCRPRSLCSRIGCARARRHLGHIWPTVGALQQASGMVPIVFVLTIGPVGSGRVASLAHPRRQRHR